jgi:cytochrome c oxidase subunit 1
MLFDILFQTGVYLPEKGGDPLLWQHLSGSSDIPRCTSFSCRPLGIIGEILPVFSRKPLFGYKAIVYSTIAAGIRASFVWAHHQFISV